MSFTVTDLQFEFKKWGNEGFGLITENMTIQLREASPVKSGWLSTNWVPQSNTEFDGLNGSKGSISRSFQRKAIAQVRQDLNAGIVKSINLTNNVPYVVNVEYGGPHNTGRHFIDPAIAKAIAITEKELRARARKRKIKINKDINL
jgi:hypothetical protein